MSGANSVYEPTENGFTVYVRWVDHPSEEPTIGNRAFPNPLTVETAAALGLRLRWTAMLTQNEQEEETTATETAQTASGLESDLAFELSPNPVRGQLTLSSLQAFDLYEVTTTTGQSLGKHRSETIDVSALAPGIYILKAHRGHRFAVRRFVKH